MSRNVLLIIVDFKINASTYIKLKYIIARKKAQLLKHYVISDAKCIFYRSNDLLHKIILCLNNTKKY